MPFPRKFQATATDRREFTRARVAQHEGDEALAAQDSVLVQIARPYAQALFDLVTELMHQPLQQVSDLLFGRAGAGLRSARHDGRLGNH